MEPRSQPNESVVLATLVIYAYNEERFISKAIESAFAQTYSPLEVVLSDDGSADRTYCIMQEMSAAYIGPHKIILNRNERNIGIGSQLNAAVAKSTGELIVLANADDVSLPNRVRVLVERWKASDCRARVITNDLALIGAAGQSLGRIMNTETIFQSLEDGVRRRFGGVAAASLAVRRDVFEAFGPLPDNLLLEDNALYLRATLLGERVHLREPLVNYRVHADNISQAYDLVDFQEWRTRHHRKAIWQKSESVKAYLQMLRDLHSVPADSWPVEDLKRARWAAMEKLLENAMLRDYYLGDDTVTTGHRVATLLRLLRLVFKLAIKRALPVIERRNDYWHYRQVSKK
jgi:glycosyltransferase involved in cell wall biosynthesis